MQPGNVEQARALAVERWKQFYCFDLDPSTWDELFAQYHPCDVLQACKELKGTRSQNPAVVYERLLYILESLTAFRFSSR
jgi:hypothetical protein